MRLAGYLAKSHQISGHFQAIIEKSFELRCKIKSDESSADISGCDQMKNAQSMTSTTFTFLQSEN